MGIVATIKAALVAIPEITGLIRDIRDGIKKISDDRDDAKLAEFKRKVNLKVKRIQHAKSKEETATLVAELNTIK